MTRGVRGNMTVAEALRRVLKGTGLRAIQVSPFVFRVVREDVPVRTAPVRQRVVVRSPKPVAVTAGEIIVTGQKRPQVLGKIPMSLAVVSFGDLSAGVVRGARDIALSVEGLALTNLGPGRNRQFIRGVADSPFNGLSQSTVAVILDEARITFDAPDPDLRLTDVESVEILKGPQGPLYGSGALGGIYHVVTRKPVLDETRASGIVAVEAVEHGGIGGSVDAILNLPLVEDRLGIRAVGYTVRDGGWIDNIGGRRDANRTSIVGGRVAIRWQPAPDWTIDLGAVTQSLNVRDSQYVTASHETLDRVAPIAEPTDNDVQALSGVAQGQFGNVKATWATSYIRQSVDFIADASAAAAKFGETAPARFRDNRSYSVFNQEVRVTPAADGKWVAGASFLKARSHVVGTIEGASSVALPVETLDRRISEVAVFAEGECFVTGSCRRDGRRPAVPHRSRG